MALLIYRKGSALILAVLVGLLCTACSRADRRESSGVEASSGGASASVSEEVEESGLIDPYKEETRLFAQEDEEVSEEVAKGEISSLGSEEDNAESSAPTVPERDGEGAESGAIPPETASSVPPVEEVQPEAALPVELPEERQTELPAESEPGPARDTVLLPEGISEPRVEQLVLLLINEDRAVAGREALGMQEEMRLAAGIRSSEVLQTLSHTRPNGTPYNTAFDEAGFSYAGKYHGENVLYLQAPRSRFTEQSLADRIFEELKSSPGHYRNMLQENFLQAGIGVHIAYNGEMMEVGCAQLFAGI